MLRTRKDSRHQLPQKKETAKRASSECAKENSEANVEKKDDSGYKRLHRNACRTKVC
jgi:hypothetical protein